MVGQSSQTILTRRQCLTALGVGALALPGGILLAEELKLAALIESAPQTHPLIPALKAALVASDAAKALKDYEAILTKTELVGRQTITTRLQVKVRHTPFSVYVKYLEPHAGREAIYVTGRNDGKLMVHDTGLASLAGTLSLDPTGSTAMVDNRYPVTMIGLQSLVDTVMNQWIGLTKSSGVTVNNYPNAKIGDQTCRGIETVLAEAVNTNSFQTTRLYLDQATQLPLRVQQYAFPTRRGQKPVLVEDYLYQNVRTNIGLAEIDFDTRNPRYGY